MSNNDFLDVVVNRRSIRRYKDNKIDKQEILDILNLAVKSPSSRNMQPWEFVVVESDEAKDNLSQMVYSNVQQIKTSSFALIIFSRQILEDNIEVVAEGEVVSGNFPAENKDEYVAYMKKSYASMDDDSKAHIATFDTGLLTANFLNAARHFGYDTNVIGGFVRDQVKDAFAPADNLNPAIVISVGIADEEGKTTYRIPAEDITKFV
ncbi:hypothetical protein BG262_05435 [Floricoccus penangensis]|uniref:Nitroreductase domain-containing protein n=1 Tax=Floricoccus penangensis TaxID=1859475 RepID=A0A9Q5NZK2_9LACT|nr:nitroreductase family protein [Floricoccus penangensis]OFI46458.1 hypothetical protein BG262_05435 [Floricoccus penangensis]